MNDKEKFLTLRDILRPIFKWRCQVIIIIITAVVIGTLVAFLMPPEYTGTGRILVKRASLGNDELQGEIHPKFTSNLRQLNQKDDINTVIAMVESKDLIEQIIQDTGLTMKTFDYIPDYRYYVRLAYKGTRNFLRFIWNNFKYALHIAKRPTPEEAEAARKTELLDAVYKALQVKQITDSDVIEVKFSCGNRMLAKQFAEAICQQALVWHTKKRTEAEANLAFYTHQTEILKDKIVNLEKELGGGKDRADYIGAEQRKQLIVNEQVKAESKLNEALARRDALKAGINELRRELKRVKERITVSSDQAVNPVRLGIEKKLIGYKLELAKKKTKFADDSRIVKDLEIQIEETERFLRDIDRTIARSRTKGINTIYQKLQEILLSKLSQLSATEAEIRRRTNIIKNYRDKLFSLSQAAVTAGLVQEQQKALKKTFNAYLQNAEQARLNYLREKTRLANLVIIQHPHYPLKASRPVKWIYILASLACGLISALTWAFIKDFNDTTYWNPEQLSHDIDAPLMGTIQYEDSDKNSRRWGRCFFWLHKDQHATH